MQYHFEQMDMYGKNIEQAELANRNRRTNTDIHEQRPTKNTK